MVWMLTVVAWTTLQFVNSQQVNPVVETSKGAVEGLNVDPDPVSGASYRAFIGIPYGDKPIRFQVPQERSAWTGNLIVQNDGPPCPQPLRRGTKRPMSVGNFSEDCLYLNVFTPLNATATSKLPVMAFIHGSAFTGGSSSSKKMGPDFLVPQGVILVTMNYRLGAAGYLTLGTKEAPGNLGLHDTRLALQWVQKEITQFGGDPTQVTLFGESAGGISTHYHYMTPLSAGLFNKAISESGCAMMDSGHVTTAEAIRRSLLLAGALGCNTTVHSTAILQCLQQADINDVINNQSIPLSDQLVISGNDLRFVPIMDDYLITDKPFFSGTVDAMMKGALDRSIPLIMGFNTDEGILRFENEAAWSRAESNLGDFIPLEVYPGVSNDTKTILATKIRDRYFKNTTSSEKIKALVKLYTDTSFAYASVKMSRYYAKLAFGYLFAYQGSWNTAPPFFAPFNISGVNHGDELAYLFYDSLNSNQDMNASDTNTPNLNMKNMMVQMWTSFAKSGSPSQTWKTISAGNYLVIDSKLRSMNSAEFEKEYYTFWAGIEAEAKGSAVSSTSKISTFAMFITVYCIVRTYV